MSQPWLVLCHCFKQCRQKLCRHGRCFGSVNDFGTHRTRNFFTEIMKQRFDIHVVMRNKRLTAKQGFRGTQLETMKSCDFLFLALLGIVSVDYDNFFACSSQPWNFVLRAFFILFWIRIPKNVALTYPV